MATGGSGGTKGNRRSPGFTAFIITVVAMSAIIGLAILAYRNPAATGRVQHTMDTFTGIAAGTVFVFAGFFLLRAGFSSMNTRRLMGDTPRSTIRAMAMGLVEVSGIARAAATLVAPLTGKRSVYYKLTCEQYQSSDNDSGWKEFHSDTRHVRFSLKDATGTATVAPDGATVHAPMTGVLYQKDRFVPGHGRALLDRLLACDGTRSVGSVGEFGAVLSREEPAIIGSGDRRYREYCIEPGRYLYVLGTATPGKTGAVLRKGLPGSDFIISAYSEGSLTDTMGVDTILIFVFSAITFIAGISILAWTITRGPQ
ncbi:MAG: hypothetical protein KBA61_07255 [Spirochaetes bacterium]|nr:hypothetical protein [Spirochaetota bacterium]